MILLLVKGTEKRFEGANSNFSKALMAIKWVMVGQASINLSSTLLLHVV